MQTCWKLLFTNVRWLTMSQTVYETSAYNMVKIFPAENIFMELATKHIFYRIDLQ